MPPTTKDPEELELEEPRVDEVEPDDRPERVPVRAREDEMDDVEDDVEEIDLDDLSAMEGPDA